MPMIKNPYPVVKTITVIWEVMSVSTPQERLYVAKSTATDLTRQQGKRLQRLRETRGLSKPRLADRLGFRSSQTYELYERGVSVMRLDQVPLWADAFEVTPDDFLAIIFGDADPQPWSLEAELRAVGVPEWAIQRALQAAHGEPQVIQRWIAEKLREMVISGELPRNEPSGNHASPLAFLRHA
jgi:transcriptional regulator with XRE-family HTH domain